MSTIDIAAEALTDSMCLPMLLSACRIVGSEASATGVVRLVIEGDGIPPGRVEAIITRVMAGPTLQITTTFRPVKEGE